MHQHSRRRIDPISVRAGFLTGEPVDRELHELRAGMQIELGLDSLAVRFDRFDAQSERIRGLASAHPLTDQMQDLQLTIAQAVDGVGRYIGPAKAGLLYHVASNIVRNVDFAIEHPAQRHQYLFARGMLHDVAVGADGQQPFRIDGFVVTREYENRQPPVVGAYIAHQLDSVTLIESDVRDHHIRAALFDRNSRVACRIGFGTYEQIILAVDDPPQPLPNDGMIVDDEHPARAPLAAGDGRRSRS